MYIYCVSIAQTSGYTTETSILEWDGMEVSCVFTVSVCPVWTVIREDKVIGCAFIMWHSKDNWTVLLISRKSVTGGESYSY